MSGLLLSYLSISLLCFLLFLIFTFQIRKRKVKCEGQCKSVQEMTIAKIWKVVNGQLPKNAASGITQLEIVKNLLKDSAFATSSFPTPTVIVGRYEEVKEIQGSADFDDRPILGLLRVRTSKIGNSGILQNNGASWKEARRYAMKKLGQLGLGKKAHMQSIICNETKDLLTHLKNVKVETGNNIHIEDIFELFVINIIWSIAAGEKFARHDPDFQNLKDNARVMGNVSVAALFLSDIKLFRYLLLKFGPDTFGCRGFYKAMTDKSNYFRGFVKRRYESGQYKFRENKDLIDGFLEEIDLHANSDKTDAYNFENLTIFLADLFSAGMDTTSQTMNAAIMWMIKYPEVQRKIQKEIDEVVGGGRLPAYATDSNKMPYTNAVLLEINRITNQFPFNPRMAKKDTELGGMPIKKGTQVIIWYYSFRMSEDFWGNPYEFKPERFLDSNNTLIKEKVDHIVAFGGGSRACIGESVATATIFHFFTAILQRFHVSAAEGTEILRMVDNISIVNSVIPFNFSICSRHADHIFPTPKHDFENFSRLV